MEIETLRWFQQVAEGVTVTEVGQLYQVTQSGVSRALDRLEHEVGTPLLRRSGRVLRPTLAGTVLKRHVDALLNQFDDGLAAVQQVVDPDTGTVSVAFQPSFGTWLVPGLIRSFRAERPGVQFALEQVRGGVISALLEGGRVDLEITTVRVPDPTLRWQRLVREPLCLAVPADHPLAGRVSVHLAEAAQEHFVVLPPRSGLREQAADLCAKAGFEPRTAFEGEDLPTVRGLVAAGLGVAILPAAHHERGTPAAGDADGGLRHLPLLDPLAYRDVGLAWSTERRLLPAAELFRRHVIERAAAGGL